jgi:hypothetical protein
MELGYYICKKKRIKNGFKQYHEVQSKVLVWHTHAKILYADKRKKKKNFNRTNFLCWLEQV